MILCAYLRLRLLAHGYRLQPCGRLDVDRENDGVLDLVGLWVRPARRAASAQTDRAQRLPSSATGTTATPSSARWQRHAGQPLGVLVALLGQTEREDRYSSAKSHAESTPAAIIPLRLALPREARVASTAQRGAHRPQAQQARQALVGASLLPFLMMMGQWPWRHSLVRQRRFEKIWAGEGEAVDVSVSVL